MVAVTEDRKGAEGEEEENEEGVESGEVHDGRRGMR